jgi:sulfur-oxidizing protein SoxY
VEKNPTVLIAQFDLMPGTVADIITRIKMAETSDVVALVQAGGEFYMSKKLVEVMENGCG